jgi:hypothetical protein
VPDYIKQCATCEEWKHKDKLVDDVCEECRDLMRHRLSIDLEYSERVGMWARGLAPSIAPQGQFRQIWTPQGRHSVKWEKEWTKLSKQQRIPQR